MLQRTPRGYWNVSSNQRAFLDDLASKLHITNKDDWYLVTSESLRKHGANGLLQKYNGSTTKLLPEIYAEYLQ